MFRTNWKFEYRIINTQFRLKHKWKKPTGHDTKIEVYDERVKGKVPLIFPNKNYVKWYMCGPTVYDTSHIGHASCYVKLDIIHRILKEYYDIHPVVAIGVTDVSEDIIKKATLLRKPIWEITNKYSVEFFEQMNALNVLQPAFKLKVSNHMKQIVQFIDLLIRRRAAYVGNDGSVYFNTEADPNYGRFREPEAVEALRSEPVKRNPRDFALWKVNTGNGMWNSPWGRGAPGWHIECSAMASHVFGNTLDLHSGGSDLIFPHHENEEAQSTCYHKCDQWVNYWLHTGLIKVGTVKMSKSLGNFLPISQFLEHYKSDHLRMFCLMSSYRTDLTFDDQTIRLAISTCEKISSFLDMAESYIAGTWLLGNVDEAQLLQELKNTKETVKKCLDDDFGTPEALKAVMMLVKTCSKMLNEKCEKTSSRSPGVVAILRLYVKQFFDSFGFTFMEPVEKGQSTSAINTVITAAVNARAQVRGASLAILAMKKSQNLLALCDQFRDKLLSSGVVVNDLAPSQSQWSFDSSTVNNKTLLKDVIDYTVWFRKGILSETSQMPYSETATELSNICKQIKLYFGTLGVDIRDNPNTRLDWTFPNPDKGNSPLLEGVIMSTLHFHSQVREAAEALPEEKTKEDLLCYCESIISDLDDLGVKVDEKKNVFEIEDEAGMFLLNNVVDIFVHFRDQALIIAYNTQDSNLKTNLFRANAAGRKTLASFGFYIHEASANALSTWNMKFSLANSSVMTNIVDVTVKLLNNIVKSSKETNDRVEKLALDDLCDSVIADLRAMGIVVGKLGKGKPSWYFQPSKFQERHPITCTPQVSDTQKMQHIADSNISQKFI